MLLILMNGKLREIPNLIFVCHHFLSTHCTAWKFKSTFLQRFKVLETQFRDLLPSDNIVKNQFEDFLAERYGYVKNMTESQFMQYAVNVESGGRYDDFVRYNFLKISLMSSLCQIIAVLPASSVDCERGFSNFGRVKSNLRSQLGDGNLESLMRISTTAMDVVTLRQEHGNALTKRWRQRKDGRLSGERDPLLQKYDS